MIHRGVDLQAQEAGQGTDRDLRRAGWIEGQAIDAETGEPVHLDKVIVCNFEPQAERRGRPAGLPERLRAIGAGPVPSVVPRRPTSIT